MNHYTSKKTLIVFCLLLLPCLVVASPGPIYMMTCNPGGNMSIDYGAWTGHAGTSWPPTMSLTIKNIKPAMDKPANQLAPGECSWESKLQNIPFTTMLHPGLTDMRTVVSYRNGSLIYHPLLVAQSPRNGQDKRQFNYLERFLRGTKFTVKVKFDGVSTHQFHHFVSE
ncbi:MAG: hypothetical protein R3F02_16705 [Thiolinea sp.]